MKLVPIFMSISLFMCLGNTIIAQIAISNIHNASLKYGDNDLWVNGNLEDVELSSRKMIKIGTGDTAFLLSNTTIRCEKLIFSCAKQIIIKGTVSVTAKDIEFLNDVDLKFEGVGAKVFITYTNSMQSNNRVVKVEISDYMKFSCEKK